MKNKTKIWLSLWILLVLIIGLVVYKGLSQNPLYNASTLTWAVNTWTNDTTLSWEEVWLSFDDILYTWKEYSFKNVMLTLDDNRSDSTITSIPIDWMEKAWITSLTCNSTITDMWWCNVWYWMFTYKDIYLTVWYIGDRPSLPTDDIWEDIIKLNPEFLLIKNEENAKMVFENIISKYYQIYSIWSKKLVINWQESFAVDALMVFGNHFQEVLVIMHPDTSKINVLWFHRLILDTTKFDYMMNNPDVQSAISSVKFIK